MLISGNHDGATLQERVAAYADALTPAESRLATYMLRNPDEVVGSSASELAALARSSDATVVRTAKSLGYSGFPELKKSLIGSLSRRRNLASVLDDRMASYGSKDRGLGKALDDTISMAQQLKEDLSLEDWGRAIDALNSASRVFSLGFGPATSLAQYMTLSLSRIGIDARTISTTGFRLADDLMTLRETDTVLIFAPIRLFREIDVTIDCARAVGAKVIVITEALRLALAERVDAVLTTPQTTTNSASELSAGLILGHALVLAIAADNRERSLQSLTKLNELRTEVTGTELDVPTIPNET
jgi:DNA-binding MurR/RpiR family transcriptional regulator